VVGRLFDVPAMAKMMVSRFVRRHCAAAGGNASSKN